MRSERAGSAESDEVSGSHSNSSLAKSVTPKSARKAREIKTAAQKLIAHRRLSQKLSFELNTKSA